MIYPEEPEDCVLPNLLTEGQAILQQGLRQHYNKMIPRLIRQRKDVGASAIISNWKNAQLHIEQWMKRIQQMNLDFDLHNWATNTSITISQTHALLSTITVLQTDINDIVLYIPNACKDVRSRTLHSPRRRAPRN